MEKIDRLGWAAGISVEVFGLRIGVRVRDLLTLDRLLSVIPAGWILSQTAVVDRLYSVVTPGARRVNMRQMCVLYADHGMVSRTAEIEEMLKVFEADLDFYIAANSKKHLFVHAGAVQWNDYVVVIPGRSRTGKTTLVAEFLKHGAAYYSDDLIGIDADGHLHPYPRDLSIRSPETSKRVFPQEFGAEIAQPRPISLVFITEYVEKTSWNVQPISRGRGVLSMLENTPSARKHPDFALDVLERAVSSAEIWKGHRGESVHAVYEMQRYLDREGLR